MDNPPFNTVVITENSESQILGIRWDQTRDILQFSYKTQGHSNVVNKRSILSEVAKLFDPLGLLGPIITNAKLILQELWQSGVEWDESVPQHIHSRWMTFKQANPSQFNYTDSVTQVSGLTVPAFIFAPAKPPGIGFRTELLCSKSRVAPLKAITLPRLELCAAVLLARLLKKITESFDLPNSRVFLWSDSTIALNWIASPSRRWSVFVSNRVGEVQRLTSPESWRHVPSPDNPADILSRGIDPGMLPRATLWWQGPEFLQRSESHWPTGELPRLEDELPERRAIPATTAILQPSIVDDLMSKYSSLDKVCRILAFCFRICKKSRLTGSDIPSTFISPNEMSHALRIACKTIQKHAFVEEYRSLSKGAPISTSSKILTMSPFLDEDGLIRVGGRLKNSEQNAEACHPILLSAKHELTKRIIQREYIRNKHAGTQATMAFVRQQFWPLSLRSTTRKVTRNCVTCFKSKPVHSEAIMGSLPSGRVTASKPFSHCGVDYAGPVSLKEGKRRNARIHKAYISIFVCFATKAVHIELVSDLTSEAFLATLRRFIARRGKPVCMYSDNGTNFVGANKQIKELYDLVAREQTQESVKNFLRGQETSWSFIPPNAPHFGGLWEAAVKSAKQATVLCEIEATLNSRPLTQLSNDPNDLTPLTPGHFLVGAPLNSIPSPDLIDERTKWKKNLGAALEPGQLVIIKQQGLAPLQWLVGRIQEVHPDSDGISRSAVIKTTKGNLIRPITKLAILPIHQ
ncbi:PREDICTED: uncharacterized protein LOC105556404 [Vollenhovia emeryi]|uniref:uncharacterized protein LOC105556404 n=1 Tax=Vollenhovia emeryi TaxID=411798 RepID=UPI0005F44275|nr:PREDICTED: uncharacterized protein LOC105556404 [Vollenhovia emeryi]